MAAGDAPKLIARNAAAIRRFADPGLVTPTGTGNPVSTRLESGIGNCFPGLEFDLRNLERRFFPYLEIDIVSDFLLLAGVDTEGVSKAQAAGTLSAADASVYARLEDLRGQTLVLARRLGGTFAVLGAKSYAIDLPPLGGRPSVPGDLSRPSTGPGRRPPDAWTAVRMLIEGTDVTLEFVNGLNTDSITVTAPRARYLDDNGCLAEAFLPGELSQSLCSPWTHDFRDCGCYYWASNHPDIAQPVLPIGVEPDQPWNAAVPWERADRSIGPQPPAAATERSARPVELDHYEINNRWQALHFVVGRREIAVPFSQKPKAGTPFQDLPTLRRNLTYAAGVELAVAQEYMAAAFSLKLEGDATVTDAELRDDIRASRAELMRIAIGEMRHTRIVNDVLRGLSDAGAFQPALGVASMLPHHDPGPFRLTEARAATRQAIDDFIQIEAQSTGVDSLYHDVLATLEFPPADVAPRVTDEWRQAIRSVIAEGEDHFETFLNIREWLSIHPESAYLRGVAMTQAPPGLAEDRDLQAAYAALLQQLFIGYRKGRFLGSPEINAGRAAMIGPGIQAKAEAVAARGFLVVFRTPNDPRFAPVDPPSMLTS